jgi:hypothetical protein
MTNSNLSDADKDAILYKAYYTDHYTVGRDALFYYISKTLGNKFISKAYIGFWLSKQESQQVYAQRKKQTTIRPIISKRVGAILQIDLIDFSKKPSQEGYTYILNVIDVFSRKCWLRPLKQKTNKSVIKNLNIIVNEINDLGIIVSVIQSDNGKEFSDLNYGKAIKHIKSQSYTPQQQAIVERSNSSLKSILNKVLYNKHLETWNTEILKIVQDVYNDTVNRSISKTPNEAYALDEQGQKELHQKQKENHALSYKQVDTVLKLGDTVRVVEQFKIKSKGQPLYSMELFNISKVIKGNGISTIPRYQIKDKKGKRVQGNYPISKLLFIPAVETI